MVLGLASTGLHSNGYSLARKIVFDIAGLKVDDYVEELGRTVGEVLLEPTRIYVRAVRQALGYYRVKSVDPRHRPHHRRRAAREPRPHRAPKASRWSSSGARWPMPPVFPWLQRLGQVEQAEMDQVFNMGMGLVMVVSPYYADSIQHQLKRGGVDSWPIGHVRPGPGGVVWKE